MAGRDVILWFRRDLRLTDHPALERAIDRAAANGGRVLPLFVLDPLLLGRSGPNRIAHLYGCLRALRADGVPLVVRHGDPVEVLPRLAASLSADAVVVTGDAAPYGRARDESVRCALTERGIDWEAVDTPYAVDPGIVRKGDGTPFKVFTPFSRVWVPLAMATTPGPRIDPARVDWAAAPGGGGSADGAGPGEIPADPPGTAPDLPEVGERAAAERVARFVADGIDHYDERRNDPGADATSRLSPDLKWGVLHPRQLLPHTRAGGRGREVFRSELCWREFYADVLWHHPHTVRDAFVVQMDDMAVDEGPLADERFAAWCEGRTGYPFVDAGMRQLLAEGWMHNRVRMAVASFLVKDLHLDWRRGAKWFMRHLVDGDVASNQHGWQWTAGTGTDAAPYFRIFNPVSQGKRFDPDGSYVRRWIPELADVPTKFVQEPWLAPGAAAKQADLFGADGGEGAGRAYPSPIVDHAVERDESLARYAAVRERGSAPPAAP